MFESYLQVSLFLLTHQVYNNNNNNNITTKSVYLLFLKEYSILQNVDIFLHNFTVYDNLTNLTWQRQSDIVVNIVFIMCKVTNIIKRRE